MKINTDHLSRYCDPVLDAIFEGLKRVTQNPQNLDDSSAAALIPDILEMWQNGKRDFTPSQKAALQQVYQLQVDIIHLLAQL